MRLIPVGRGALTLSEVPERGPNRLHLDNLFQIKFIHLSKQNFIPPQVITIINYYLII